MIIKCPECELQASDKAVACPHCGYPFKSEEYKPRKRKTNRRKRLPNGFGQITEIKGRSLRRPFRVMITVGKTETGKPISKLLQPNAYFETYNDAYAALIEYNKNPYVLEAGMTMQELYDRWTAEYFPTLKRDSSIRTTTAAWAYCSSIYNVKVAEVRTRHIKQCITEGTTIIKGKEQQSTANFKLKIKSMFNTMFDYAVEYELVDKNYARAFNISDKVTKQAEVKKVAHIDFTDDELNTLWQNINEHYVDMVIIQCYSGWRPQEIGLIEMDNVDLENWSFTCGMKTDAGIDRTVPIHSKIRHLVKARYEHAQSIGSKYLFNATDVKRSRSNSLFMSYDKYYKKFVMVRDSLGLNPKHKPHDPRVQFVTMAKKYHVDEYAIKYMVGHTINDVTEKVYTRREFEWLAEEIEKIK